MASSTIVDLGLEGAKFINDRLVGGGALSKSYLAINGPAQSSCSVVLNADRNYGATDFNRGGLTSMRQTTSWLFFSGVIRPGVSILIEDQFARYTDPEIEPLTDRAFIAGDGTVIHALGCNEQSMTNLSDIFCWLKGLSLPAA
jgi:hypothetical protein